MNRGQIRQRRFMKSQGRRKILTIIRHKKKHIHYVSDLKDFTFLQRLLSLFGKYAPVQKWDKKMNRSAWTAL